MPTVNHMENYAERKQRDILFNLINFTLIHQGATVTNGHVQSDYDAVHRPHSLSTRVSNLACSSVTGL